MMSQTDPLPEWMRKEIRRQDQRWKGRVSDAFALSAPLEESRTSEFPKSSSTFAVHVRPRQADFSREFERSMAELKGAINTS